MEQGDKEGEGPFGEGREEEMEEESFFFDLFFRELFGDALVEGGRAGEEGGTESGLLAEGSVMEGLDVDFRRGFREEEEQ